MYSIEIQRRMSSAETCVEDLQCNKQTKHDESDPEYAVFHEVTLRDTVCIFWDLCILHFGISFKSRINPGYYKALGILNPCKSHSTYLKPYKTVSDQQLRNILFCFKIKVIKIKVYEYSSSAETF